MLIPFLRLSQYIFFAQHSYSFPSSTTFYIFLQPMRRLSIVWLCLVFTLSVPKLNEPVLAYLHEVIHRERSSLRLSKRPDFYIRRTEGNLLETGGSRRRQRDPIATESKHRHVTIHVTLDCYVGHQKECFKSPSTCNILDLCSV